jgi:hypothetical protein
MRWPVPTQSVRCLSSMTLLAVAACTAPTPSFTAANSAAAPTDALQSRIALGRSLVINHSCGGCHGGGDGNPAAAGWLSGSRDTSQEFQVGPFRTRARNLTPDNATGLGRFTERQIFNSLRYGLRPENTPDVDITSAVPGQGNFPARPHYLAPPMPWPGWRNMSDEELYAIAAYLKSGLKPVVNKVAESDGPPDFWASVYTVDKIGVYPVAAYPTINETGGH